MHSVSAWSPHYVKDKSLLKRVRMVYLGLEKTGWASSWTRSAKPWASLGGGWYRQEAAQGKSLPGMLPQAAALGPC